MNRLVSLKKLLLHKRFVYSVLILSLLGLFLAAFAYAHYFGPVDPYAGQVNFIVHPNESRDEIANTLRKEGFIRSRFVFEVALIKADHGGTIRPGGYTLSANMDVWSIAGALVRPPAMIFFTFPPGWRKEQIADKLTPALNWTQEQKTEWLTVDTAPSPSFVEGVYFPDTYLIASNQTPAGVATQFRTRFQVAFAPDAIQSQQENLPWTEVVILASILEREAAGAKDMPLIAGIMLNRLKAHMPLQIDATLQYIRGTENNWWPVPTPADKSLVSDFNTYKHAGLPPYAISEPGLGAINAVLNAQHTNCLYYLHDPSGQIHCSVNYEGQLANVSKYLK